MTNHESQSDHSRRDFLKTSAAAVGSAVAANLASLPAVHAAGSDTIRVGLIGCGGRGTGAAENVLSSAPGVEIIALGDYYKADENRGVEPCRRHLIDFAQSDTKVKELGNKVDLPEERCYVGLDAHQKVIATPGVNYVILATPPGFRPTHLQAAVDAGKNIFAEKPVGVDGPGIRAVLAAYEQAKSKNLAIVAGTQRRHQLGYVETLKRVHDGAIGNVVSARGYWNQGPIWFRPRTGGMSDLDYQIHNWYNFVWLCGDHIVEQHVHNLDVLNWAMGQHPLRALGMGGRVNPCKDPNVDGHIYNFFSIEYLYPDGRHAHSMCRQIAGTDGNFPDLGGVSEALVGTKGTCQVNRYTIRGEKSWRYPSQHSGGDPNPYVQEHTDLIASIRAAKPLNELKTVAESTLTAIMGRMSAYTGKAVAWEQALNSSQSYMPQPLTSANLPVPPVAIPGQTPLV